MKEEDLKVGTVLKNKIQDDDYIRIFRVVDIGLGKFYLFEAIRMKKGIYACDCYSINQINEIYEIVDKIPAKIEEVEEEVPIYIDKYWYEQIENGASIQNVKINICNYEVCECFPNTWIELCKIKRKVKREINFNWSENKWE